MSIHRLFPAALVVPVLLLAAFGREGKIKPEDLIAKHLASIGSGEAISAVRNRIIEGKAQVIFRLGGQGQLNGAGQFVSDGQRLYFGMMFPALEYRSDQFVYDGREVAVSQLAPGRRSQIGIVIYQNDFFLKEGLLGGAMTTAWALLDVAGRRPKLDYSGLRKVEGKQLHELKYRARKGGGDFQVALYFEPETFRHVRSSYRLIIPESMATRPEASSSQQRTVVTLYEQFSEFSVADALTLPHNYRLILTIEGQGGSSITEWSFRADRMLHNQPVDVSSFALK